MSRIIEAPDTLELVSREQLDALIDFAGVIDPEASVETPSPTPGTPNTANTARTPFDVPGFLARTNIEVHHVTINDQELNGVVSDNTAINNNTGDNIISDGAFNDAAGFIGTVQNSGNNVLIQNSTIINVAVEP